MQACLCFLPTLAYILAKLFNLVFFHLRNTDKCVHFSSSDHICFHFLTHRLKYCITSTAGSNQKITLTSNCTKKNPEQQIRNTFKLLFWLLLYYRFSMISVFWLFSSHVISTRDYMRLREMSLLTCCTQQWKSVWCPPMHWIMHILSSSLNSCKHCKEKTVCK